MADSTNVKLRVPLGRPIKYEEVDSNFQELVNVIDEFNQNVSDQGDTNTSLQTQINDKVEISVYDQHTIDQGVVNVNLQDQINDKVDDVDGVADNLTIEKNLYIADSLSSATDLDGVVVSVTTGVVNISQNSSEAAAIELQIDGAKVWTNANDGAGSGLDADLLGGVAFGDYVTEAPETGVQFTRKDGAWSEVQTTQTTWGDVQGALADQTDLEARLQSIENIEFNVTTTSTNKTLTHTERCYVLASTLDITLPASPSVGDYVGIGVKDFKDVNVLRNGENIMNLAEDLLIDVKNSSTTLVYVNGTEGWRIV